MTHPPPETAPCLWSGPPGLKQHRPAVVLGSVTRPRPLLWTYVSPCGPRAAQLVPAGERVHSLVLWMRGELVEFICLVCRSAAPRHCLAECSSADSGHSVARDDQLSYYMLQIPGLIYPIV